MAQFPPTGIKEDSKNHSITDEDNVMKQKTEGGYTLTRPRTTKVRKIINTSFSHLDGEQKKTLSAFYDSVSTHSRFTYDIPSELSGDPIVTLNVKFEKPIVWKYKGIGIARLWDTDQIVLLEQ